MVDDLPSTANLLARADRAIATSRRLKVETAALHDTARLYLEGCRDRMDQASVAQASRAMARRRIDPT